MATKTRRRVRNTACGVFVWKVIRAASLYCPKRMGLGGIGRIPAAPGAASPAQDPRRWVAQRSTRCAGGGPCTVRAGAHRCHGLRGRHTSRADVRGSQARNRSGDGRFSTSPVPSTAIGPAAVERMRRKSRRGAGRNTKTSGQRTRSGPPPMTSRSRAGLRHHVSSRQSPAQTRHEHAACAPVGQIY